MVEIDAVAKRYELLGIVLFSNICDGIEETYDIVGERLIVIGDLLRERCRLPFPGVVRT